MTPCWWSYYALLKSYKSGHMQDLFVLIFLFTTWGCHGMHLDEKLFWSVDAKQPLIEAKCRCLLASSWPQKSCHKQTMHEARKKYFCFSSPCACYIKLRISTFYWKLKDYYRKFRNISKNIGGKKEAGLLPNFEKKKEERNKLIFFLALEAKIIWGKTCWS